MRTQSEHSIGYGVVGLVGCAYAFVVFAISFNSSYESLLTSVQILYIILALTTFAFSVPKGADAVVVFACVNGPTLLVWYAVIPEQLSYYVPLATMAILSSIAAFCGRSMGKRFKRGR